MLEEIMKNTNEYLNLKQKKERKAYGQFFTPITTARYMSSMIKSRKIKVRILDPGAGNGLLTAALTERLLEEGSVREIEAVLFENDTNIQPLLQKNVTVMKDYCTLFNVKLNVRVIQDNFILKNREYWKKNGTRGLYDVVICNPPYLKIGKNTEEAQCMDEIVHGQPNMYFLFMAMAVKLLRKQGQFVFITPRSWTSGLYFKSFRKYFFANMSMQYIHLFHSRNNAFKEERISNDNILQETMITYGVKSAQQADQITLASCKDARSFAETERMTVPAKNCLTGLDANYILLPIEQKDLLVLEFMKQMPNSLSEAGYHFKTGQVVEFRNRKYVSYEASQDTVPLLHSCNVSGGRIHFPVETDKPQYFLHSVESSKNIIDNQNTVFLKRATAKEETKRLQPALHIADDFQYPRLSAENHLNYLVKIGDELSLCEVYGFYTMFTSEIWERYYRMLNGSTQVNSEELNSMPIPAVQTLQRIGRMAMHIWNEEKNLTIS
ncbi:MAG: Eco57I restriction-modification methylase domain-containing protein, partial [Lachnospiraceae bacterium]|nr:Eco57I restriction-modification methylase domain-containing protein [Lachnospiraceae bacterium]